MCSNQPGRARHLYAYKWLVTHQPTPAEDVLDIFISTSTTGSSRFRQNNKNATLSRSCPSIALPQTTTRNLALCNKNQHQLAMQSAICPARRPERAAPRTTLITALIDAPCSASMKSQDQIRSLPASSILLRRLVNNYICIDLGTWNSIFGRRRRISQRRT
jgi:hypothetical protein